MTAIEILRAASRSVPNEDYVQFMAAVDAVAGLVGKANACALSLTPADDSHNDGLYVVRARYVHELRAALARDEGEQADELRQAHAAVAELIERAQALSDSITFRIDDPRCELHCKLVDALARVGGA